jgi:hypothetical protein
MIAGNGDYRVIRLDRGAKQIVEDLQMPQKSATHIKNVLNAMAHMRIHTIKEESGNLITYRNYKSPITGREEAIEIVVGTILLPYRTFEDKGLLIPIPQEPVLISSNNTHANQLHMQMEVMAIFSKKSVQLAREGYVEITDNEWREIAEKSCLAKELYPEVISAWTTNKENPFLVNIAKNYYQLSPGYEKETKFYLDQAKIREKQSQRGKASARKKSKNRRP